MLATDSNATALIVMVTQNLEAHERCVASGKPLMTDEGISRIRQALVSARSQGTGEGLAPPLPLLTYWEASVVTCLALPCSKYFPAGIESDPGIGCVPVKRLGFAVESNIHSRQNQVISLDVHACDYARP